MPTPPRRRGRPSGGGNTAAQTREILLDAAERSFAVRGYRASTMESVAREAGYSRAAMYQQFPNRQSLDDALISRVTQRHSATILQRQQEGAGPVEMIVEAMVVVATELAHDPLLRTISEASSEGTIAQMLAKSAVVAELTEPLLQGVLERDAGNHFRRGLCAQDLTRYLIVTALSLLLDIVPGTRDPDVARRFVEGFVLPAIVNDPPELRRVFPPNTEPS